jgi:RNA polymerase sigma-70 factor (ECF subfamily)
VAGDAPSLAWVVARLTPLLLAQARYRLSRHLQGRVDPEDLVQDVWLRALPRLPDLRARNGAWSPVLIRFLSTTLLNRYRSLLQKHVLGKPSPAPLVNQADGSAEVDPLAAVPDSSLGVVTRVVRNELRSDVAASIEALGSPDREIVILRGIEQASTQEVAVMLGSSANLVAVRYHRALKKLRSLLPGGVFDELVED